MTIIRTVGLLGVLLLSALSWIGMPGSVRAKTDHRMTKEEALRLGEAFGVVVGEVDEEIRRMLRLQRPEGVVVFEVIGNRPADLAGIKPKSIIKEIDKMEIKTLEDFGRALEAASDNFTVATFEPADPDNQGVGAGLNFYFVRIPKD